MGTSSVCIHSSSPSVSSSRLHKSAGKERHPGVLLLDEEGERTVAVELDFIKDGRAEEDAGGGRGLRPLLVHFDEGLLDDIGHLQPDRVGGDAGEVSR